MSSKTTGVLIALMLAAAWVADSFCGTRATDVVMAGGDPSTIVIGVIVVGGGAVYLWFADGHVEKKDDSKKD